MFQTFDFRWVQTLATAAPGYRGGVYVILMSLTRDNSVVWRHHFPTTIACTDVGFARKGIQQRVNASRMKQDWGNMNGSGTTTG